MRVLLDAIQGWLVCEDENFKLDPSLYPDAARRVIHQQNAIGWTQVMLGRFRYEWSDVQDAFYATHHKKTDTPKRRTGQRWQVAIVGAIWSQWKLLWSSRNHDLHGATAKQQQLAISRAIRRDMQDVYDVKSQLEPSLQELLMTDLETHLQKPNWVNRHWLTIHTPLFKASLRREREAAITGMKSIRQYFGAQ